MRSLFQRKKAPPITSAAPTPPPEPSKGLLRPQSASALLATPRRKKLLEHIWQRTSLSREQYQEKMTAAGFGSITTAIVPLEEYYYAEEPHQQYLAKNPFGYCPLHATGVSYA